MELAAARVSLDPRTWRAGSLESAADEKLAALVFERLVAVDNYGRFRSILATEWSHDAASRRWQFTIRPGVKFSDGSVLTAGDVAAALQSLLPEGLKISASGAAVSIASATPAPDLLEMLASGRYFIFRAAQDGTLTGTGPFVEGIAPVGAAGAGGGSGPGTNANSSASGRGSAHLFFHENDTWSGRPFVDAIEVTLGVPPLRAMFDLQLGKADLVELAPDLVLRAAQANLRVWTSDAVTLYALRFDDTHSAAADPRLRQAVALSLERETMASVLLQKQAQPAAALLPQWLSGYAFLFRGEANLERARELQRALPSNGAGGANPLRLRVEPAGETAKLLGERVAINARQAAILIQVATGTTAHVGAAAKASVDEPGVGLFAWHYSSLSPRVELDSLFAAYNLEEPQEANSTNTALSATEQEKLYAREQRVLEAWRVVPLVEQAESVGLGAAVRDWMPARWGEWHLEDVWLETPLGNDATLSNNAAQGSAPTAAQARAASGAKP